ncbi:hypothetical protein F4819DRAFT_442584 [Hypoxylon fuscum]|nr:hypothetical protein F4819DRAFT_442584 [Hypoxylon fuscum]
MWPNHLEISLVAVIHSFVLAVRSRMAHDGHRLNEGETEFVCSDISSCTVSGDSHAALALRIAIVAVYIGWDQRLR